MIEAKKPLKVSRLPEQDTRNVAHHLTLRPPPSRVFQAKLAGELSAAADESERKEIKAEFEARERALEHDVRAMHLQFRRYLL